MENYTVLNALLLPRHSHLVYIEQRKEGKNVYAKVFGPVIENAVDGVRYARARYGKLERAELSDLIRRKTGVGDVRF